MPRLEQSFLFEWDNGLRSTPITAQCETIHLTWGQSAATGPKPVPPYSLTVYTSLYEYPFMIGAGSGSTFALTIPFPPGTQYMICMYDGNGNAGGCQDLYTVYPSAVSPLPSTCQNFSTPPRPMDVIQPPSSSSETGWPISCTDMSFLPNEGTPPYYFTAAAALRPPFNMTIDSTRSFTWAIDLDHATPFFVSIVDSSGLTWKHGGPLHAGYLEGNDVSCLGGPRGKKGIPTSAIIGSTIGAFVLGTVLACLAALYLLARANRERERFNNQNAVELIYEPQPPTEQGVYRTAHPVSAMHEGESQSDPRSLAHLDGLSPPTTSAHHESQDSSGGAGMVTVYVHEDAGRVPELSSWLEGLPAPHVDQPPLYIPSALEPGGPTTGASRFREADMRPPGAAPPTLYGANKDITDSQDQKW